MSIKNMYELNERLNNSEKYKLVVFEGTTNNFIDLDVLYENHTYLGENIYNDHTASIDKNAAIFLEKSCEKLMRFLSENDILYDSIEVLICPSFFMKEYNFTNDVTEDYNISKSDFNKNMLIDNNLVSIRFSLYAKQNGEEIVDNDQINEFTSKISKAKFLVDYNYFARCVALNGYPLEDYSYDMLIDSQINNKPTVINLDFSKNKTFR